MHRRKLSGGAHRAEYVEHRQIERDGRHLGNEVVLVDAKLADCRIDEGDRAQMRMHHALWLPGRAGGVKDVSGARRIETVGRRRQSTQSANGEGTPRADQSDDQILGNVLDWSSGEGLSSSLSRLRFVVMRAPASAMMFRPRSTGVV